MAFIKTIGPGGAVAWVEVPDEVEETAPAATEMDRLEAQVTYTAMMTDTLLEV